MGYFDRVQRSMNTPGESDVCLLTVVKEGTKQFFLTILSPEGAKADWIPAEAIVGQLREKEPRRSSPFAKENVVVNRAFVAFLHDVVRRRAPEDPELILEAAGASEGFVVVLDHRRGDAPDLLREDIIGAFEVRNGVALADSYTPNVWYEVASEHGFMTLSPWLKEILREELGRLRPSGGSADGEH